MGFLKTLVRALEDWLDPVCQDKGAVLYGECGNNIVRLRPVVDPNSGRVTAWVPDPEEVAEMARLDAIADQMGIPRVACDPAPVLPPPALPPQPAPGGLDPGGIPGL